jgi:D-apiose dehydrogenase
MNRLRGAVIGCGMIAEYHLRAWLRIPDVEIVALCDPDGSRAQQRKEAFIPAARLYADLDSLLQAESLDFVDVLTPPWLHREHCLGAAAAKVHIICQKPLCCELAEARQLISELSGYERIFAVHENHPYRPWFREILRRNEEGFFGPIRHLSLVQHDSREPPERFKAEAERGIMLEYGVHLVDMVRALLGEPHRVAASFGRVNERVRGESLATAIYECDGASAVIDISWKTHGPELGSAVVIGERGAAVYDGRMTRGQSSRFRLYQEGELVLDEARCPTDDFCESFYLLQWELVDSMLGRGPAPQPAAYNLKTLAATFAAYESATAADMASSTIRWPKLST